MKARELFAWLLILAGVAFAAGYSLAMQWPGAFVVWFALIGAAGLSILAGVKYPE